MMKLSVLLLLFMINGSTAPACHYDPLYVWPLGVSTGVSEIISNTTKGLLGTISYVMGATDHGIESAIEFSGGSNSFVELIVPENDAFLDDYTILFYLFAENISTGTIFQYTGFLNSSPDGIEIFKSSPDGFEIFKVSLQSGNIFIEILDYGSVLFHTNIKAGIWYNILFERNFSADTIKLYVDRTEVERLHINNLEEEPTESPGTLHLGGDINRENPFTGRLTCFQIIPCKSAIDLRYDSYCENGNMNLLEEETAQPTSFPTTSVTTKIGSTNIATGVSSAATVTPSYSVPSSAHLSTSATSLKPTTHFMVETSCSRFSLMKQDATFNNSADIISSANVSSITACSRLCNLYTSCFSFAVRPVNEGYECKVGPYLPSVFMFTGSRLYKRR